MNEKIKIGLLGVIAVALVVNAYFLMSDRGGNLSDPTGSKATFERTAGNSDKKVTATTTPEEARRRAVESTPNIDPLKGSQVEASGMPLTTIAFAESSHDFGTINQDTENKKIFKFTNAGSEPLIIENAKGSCGCTVPKYPKEPIAPGGTGEIEVVYKPGKQKNKQTKNITITANTSPASTILTITADVMETAS